MTFFMRWAPGLIEDLLALALEERFGGLTTIRQNNHHELEKQQNSVHCKRFISGNKSAKALNLKYNLVRGPGLAVQFKK